MHSNKSIMRPLQLISIFILLPLIQVFSIGLVAKPRCPNRCGDLHIPYPFGVGLNCSLDPYFNINCNTSSTDPPKAYLSIFNKEVVEISQSYIRLKHPFLISACYDLSDNQPMIVNLSGTPYTLSYGNMLTAIGCDDVVLQSNGISLSDGSGGCSAFCADKNDTGAVGYCPFNGCCQVQISAGTSFLGAQLIDFSGKLRRRRLFPCSYAFIQEGMWNETAFSYPLYYLHNSTALLNDNWASASRVPVMRLDWSIIGAENCGRAKLNSTTYACRYEKSVCVDDVYNGIEIGRGYLCSCLQGYEGNPYLPGGCQTISFSSSIAKPGCQDQCGKISIPFPFGVGPNCFLAPSFEILCNTTTNPPIAYIRLLNREITDLISNSSKVLVKYDRMGWTCYNWSDGISKPEKRSLIIDLSTSQYTLSERNRITAIGCDDMVVGVTDTGVDNWSSVRSSCAATCSNERINSGSSAVCRYGAAGAYAESTGCCRGPIPKGTAYLKANLTDLSGRWPRTNFWCSYAFVEYDANDQSNVLQSYPIPNDSTDVVLYREDKKVALDWRIGSVNCKEARRDEDNFVCQANTDCIDFDATTVGVGGYLCNCSKGFQGNPYLSPGCQDIDECADNTTNPCDSTSICTNIPGSYYCSCPKGYFGNGMKDGTGCMPKSKTKMISLIGVGSSALGFLLLLLLCFWLRKVFEKRKNKKRKENLFKHLLLQQQISEDTFGKTKLFSAKELDKATDHFNESRICGRGGQGVVYKGMLSDGTIVAIKRLRQVDKNQVEQFINEVVILSQINHKNVVRLLGCCLATESPQLVYEFLPNGTLFDFIHDSKIEFSLTWNMRLKIATDVAGALSYLHFSSSIPIYHRDIKSTNILLDEKYIVKVSDFGISKAVEVDQTHLTTLVKGTFGYLDPEYYRTGQYTEKSDVYSFGVILVELLTGRQPISMERSGMERNLASQFLASMQQNNLDEVLDAQVSEEGAKEKVIAVARLARRCLNIKGIMRPTMKEVAMELENLMISRIPSIIDDEPEEEVTVFEGKHEIFSDTEYTWTISDLIR